MLSSIALAYLIDEEDQMLFIDFRIQWHGADISVSSFPFATEKEPESVMNIFDSY